MRTRAFCARRASLGKSVVRLTGRLARRRIATALFEPCHAERRFEMLRFDVADERRVGIEGEPLGDDLSIHAGAGAHVHDIRGHQLPRRTPEHRDIPRENAPLNVRRRRHDERAVLAEYRPFDAAFNRQIFCSAEFAFDDEGGTKNAHKDIIIEPKMSG